MVVENPESEIITSAASNSSILHCSNSSPQDDLVHSKISEVDEVNDSIQSECSQSGDYLMSRSDSMITLEDFLSENDKSPDLRVSFTYSRDRSRPTCQMLDNGIQKILWYLQVCTGLFILVGDLCP